MNTHLLAAILTPVFLFAETSISEIEELINSDPKSFVIVEAKDIGEIPLGLISFQLVWKNMLSPQD